MMKLTLEHNLLSQFYCAVMFNCIFYHFYFTIFYVVSDKNHFLSDTTYNYHDTMRELHCNS